MKKLLLSLSLILTTFVTSAQLTVNQSVTTPSPYKVGDTIAIKYTVAKSTTTPRFFWLRYQYNNKALTFVPNSTTFTQGTSVQTYYTLWNNYKFTANGAKPTTQLYEQYKLSPWNYLTNSDWNAAQLTIQRTDVSIDGDIATQKYIIKDLGDYTDIHKLDLGYSINDVGDYIASVNTSTGKLSLSNVIGNSSQFKVRVLFPQGYDITSHQAQLMKLKTDGSGDIDWTKPAIASKALDGSGEAIFTTEVKVGDSLGVFVSAASQKTFMNNIVTVSDAYKAFLGVSQTDIMGGSTYFTRPVLEKKIGLVTKNKSVFSESDAYYLFAYVMGIDVKDKAYIPTNAAPVNQVANYKWYSGLLNQSWLEGTAKYKVNITKPIQSADMVFAWGGDLDWSHSSSPTEIASRIASGDYSNVANSLVINSIKTSAYKSMEYQQPALENTTLSVVSKLENGKVVLITTLTKEGLAGLQVIMNYDDSKLTLDNVVFDAGSSITNFSTHNNGRLTFGSIDQLKTARIKTGTPYKLIFTPKETLSNTSGLFYFVLSDAVDANGNKINLIIE
jgi:hypothetical protein